MRRLLLAVLILCAGALPAAQQRTMQPATRLLDAATTTATGAAVTPASVRRAVHVWGATSAGAGSVTVVIEVTNNPAAAVNTDWIIAGTVTLTLSTTVASDGFVIDAPWTRMRARVTAISGTGANVTVDMGSGS